MWNKIDDHLYQVYRYLMIRYGISSADRMIDPLRWWIQTGRASVPFLHRFLDTQPYMIGRRLAKGGSVQEAVDRVRKLLGA